MKREIYKRRFKEKVKSENEFYKYLTDAPEKVKIDLITYFANKKINWNKKLISLSKDEQKELINFQKALDKMDIDNKEFISYAENRDNSKNNKLNESFFTDNMDIVMSLADQFEDFTIKLDDLKLILSDISKVARKDKRKDILADLEKIDRYLPNLISLSGAMFNLEKSLKEEF